MPTTYHNNVQTNKIVKCNIIILIKITIILLALAHSEETCPHSSKACCRNVDVLWQSKEITRFESQHPLQVKSHPAGKRWED
jgi:hypothetical protein